MALSILLHPPTALWRREALAASRGTFWVRMDGASSLRIYNQPPPHPLERPAPCEEEQAKPDEARRPSKLVHHVREVEEEDGDREAGDAEVDALTTHLPHAPRNQPDRAQCAPSVDGRVLVVTAEGAEHEHPGNGNGVHPRRCAADPERDAERKPDGDQPPHRPQARRCGGAVPPRTEQDGAERAG